MLDEKPKVSVIIPTYNRANLVKRSIKSVLDQTYQNFELIVIDDNSLDDTVNVVNAFKDSRIQYICHKINRGAPAARNTGINKSRGEFIAFLDDDDEWLPEKLEIQLEYLNHRPNVGLIYAGFEVVDKDKNKIHRIYPKERGNTFPRILHSNFIGSPTAIVRRECFESVGIFDESFKSSQDWDMWIRIAQKYDVDYVPNILARYNISGNRISTNMNSVISGHTQILAKYYDFYKSHNEIYSELSMRIAINYGLNEDVPNSKKYFKIALQAHALNIRCVIHYVLLNILRKQYRAVMEFAQDHNLMIPIS